MRDAHALQPAVPLRPVGYRRGTNFVMDIGRHSTLLDRNAKARILNSLEALERVTKRHGCPNGILGRPTLSVARVLLLRFHNAGSGHCYPSYDAIQRATGFCRATIAKALAILERIGILKVTRRLIRTYDASGRVVTRQGSNLYGFREMPNLLMLPTPKAKPAKPRRLFGLRVHAMGTKCKTQHQTIENRPSEEALREVLAEKARQTPTDWRSRARAAMKI